MNYTLDLLEMSGPARVRAMFFPKVRVGLGEVSRILGMSYMQIYKRMREGTISIQVRKEKGGHPFVMVDDLIAYLYPSDPALAPSCRPEPKKGPGRRRKSTEGGAR